MNMKWIVGLVVSLSLCSTAYAWDDSMNDDLAKTLLLLKVMGGNAKVLKGHIEGSSEKCNLGINNNPNPDSKAIGMTSKIVVSEGDILIFGQNVETAGNAKTAGGFLNLFVNIDNFYSGITLTANLDANGKVIDGQNRIIRSLVAAGDGSIRIRAITTGSRDYDETIALFVQDGKITQARARNNLSQKTLSCILD